MSSVVTATGGEVSSRSVPVCVGGGWVTQRVSFQPPSCRQLAGMSVKMRTMASVGIPNTESWRQITLSLGVHSGRSCCLQYLVGETDISSMAELIQRPAALPLPGLEISKDGGGGGRNYGHAKWPGGWK